MMKDFIDDELIEQLLEATRRPTAARVREVIGKARELKGLSPQETAILLQAEDRDLVSEILQAAREIKRMIYGNRLVLFAPLYIANYCANNCLYCGFRRGNKELNRVALTMGQIRGEVEVLAREGHKRLLMLCGEHPDRSGLDYFLEAIETAYGVKTEKGGEIRRINVEIAPQEVEGYRRLKKAGIGTYVLFQETYHHETYRKMHRDGPKADYLWRLTAMHRALDEVIHDISTHGHIPSFCTACYRLGRTGQDFMDLAKPGLIQRFCRSNAIFTFMEYLEDYAAEETKTAG